MKQVEIYLNGNKIYRGSIRQGCGNENEDYSHSIPLIKKEQSPSMKIL